MHASNRDNWKKTTAVSLSEADIELSAIPLLTAHTNTHSPTATHFILCFSLLPRAPTKSSTPKGTLQ